jgi:glycosyltransferase involved in cell wall biosynthesis
VRLTRQLQSGRAGELGEPAEPRAGVAHPRPCYPAGVARHFAFVTEHTVGHVTFERLLREAAAGDGHAATWFPLTFPPRGALEALPLLRSNWSLRSSARARRLLTAHRRDWDALLFHTQTASLLSVGLMGQIPTVLSIDATPRNIDEVGSGYDHALMDERLELVKARVVRRALHAAAAVVAWSNWVRGSLVDDYGVDPAAIRVIPAGTRVPAAPPRREASERLRLLFVGGQFERKGGPELLEALAGADFPYDLQIVTQSEVAPRPGVTVHTGVGPGSALLDELYARSDAFVLPTHADASPHVVLEAMAAGLPVISTPVGAVPEMVLEGATGLLVPPGDPRALRATIERLRDPALRGAMGSAGHARARERFDAAANARRVLAVMDEVAG